MNTHKKRRTYREDCQVFCVATFANLLQDDSEHGKGLILR
jgi:hypothetical protein